MLLTGGLGVGALACSRARSDPLPPSTAVGAPTHRAVPGAVPVTLRQIREDGLGRLAKYGPAIPCEAQETIVRVPPAAEPAQPQRAPKGERVVPFHPATHYHRYDPVPAIPALAGKTGAIAPFLSSPSLAVVGRAIDLLCATQDAEAKRVLVDFVLHQGTPCVIAVGDVQIGAGLGEPTPDAGPLSLYELTDLSHHPDGSESGTLSPKVDCGQTLHRSDGVDARPGSEIDRALRDEATEVDGPAQWWSWLEAQIEARTGNPIQARQQIASTTLAPMLTQAAKRSRRSEGEVLRDVSRGKTAGELELLAWFASSDPQAHAQLVALAPAESTRSDLPPAEHAFWQQLWNQSAILDPQAYARVADELQRSFREKQTRRSPAS